MMKLVRFLSSGKHVHTYLFFSFFSLSQLGVQIIEICMATRDRNGGAVIILP